MFLDRYLCLNKDCGWIGSDPIIEYVRGKFIKDIDGTWETEEVDGQYCPQCGHDACHLVRCPHCDYEGLMDWHYSYYADEYDASATCPECEKQIMEISEIAYQEDPADDYDVCREH